MKGYDKLDPKENEGQLQSSLKEFLNHQKDQGIWESFGRSGSMLLDLLMTRPQRNMIIGFV